MYVDILKYAMIRRNKWWGNGLNIRCLSSVLDLNVDVGYKNMNFILVHANKWQVVVTFLFLGH